MDCKDNNNLNANALSWYVHLYDKLLFDIYRTHLIQIWSEISRNYYVNRQIQL